MMQLGEVVFGGVGSGLYGMLAFVIVAVFVAGLMVGRTPEYLGKKIEVYEMKMASLMILIMPILLVLVWHGAGGGRCRQGRPRICNPGAARLQRDPVRLLVGRATTTAAPSPGWAPTRRSTTRRWASPC